MKKIGMFLDEIKDQNIDISEKFQKVGRNTGNLLFWHSLKTLPDLDVKSWWYINKPDKLNLNEYKAFITTDLIWIQEMADFSRLNKVLDILGDLPLVPISIGVQANNFNPDFKLHPETVKVIKRISERCIMGVRGYYTAYILAKYGIKNFEVIGCPSMYLPGVDFKKIGKNKILPQKIVANFATFYGIQSKTRIDFLKYCATQNFGFVEQCPFRISEKNILDVTELSQIKTWIESQGNCFFDTKQWQEYMCDFDFSMGMRFHGNVMALWSGIPALFISYDSRTKELCDFYSLPNINIEEFDYSKPIERYYELANYEIFLEHYNECKNNYVNFLQKNNLYNSDSFSTHCSTIKISNKPTAVL